MTIQHNLLIAVSGFCFGASLSACHGSERNPDHCLYNQGNQTCAGYDWPDGIERPYCVDACHPQVDEYNGCVEEEPTDLECYSPCGGEKNALEDDSCLGTADESTDSGTDTTADDTTTDSETGPGPCMADEDCLDDAAPFCGDQGECISCTDTPDPDAACAGLDGGATPVCDQGSCVQCTAANAVACMGMTPVCDEGTSSCVGCDWHEQCDNACHMKEGSCFPDNVFDAGSGLGFMSLNEAVAEIGMLDLMIGVVIVNDTINVEDYNESVVVPAGMTVAFVAEPGLASPPDWRGQAAPALTVESGAVVYVQGVRIFNGTAEGVLVNGGELWVDRSEVANNDGGGIVVDGGGSLVLRNSFVGGDVNDQQAIDLVDGTLLVSYSTLASGFGASAALACTDATGSVLRNSLLVSRSDDDELQCPNVDATNSALEMMLAGNEDLGPMQTIWFEGFAAGDFHLAAAPIGIATAAMWAPGDPLVDIDGDPRPTVDGSADFAGADRTP